MISNSGEHIGEPSAGIDVIELARFDQRVDRGGAPAAGIGAAERPVFPANRDAPHRVLCSWAAANADS